jgi:hypothetical protein
LLIEGGQLVKSLSIGFLADFEQHWRSGEPGAAQIQAREAIPGGAERPFRF